MKETQKTDKLSQTSLAPGALLCLQCGKPVVQQSGHKKKFCSFRCRMDYWNSHPEQVYRRAYYALVCKYCGRPFQSYGNAHRKFCCRSCYDEHRKRGKRHDE